MRSTERLLHPQKIAGHQNEMEADRHGRRFTAHTANLCDTVRARSSVVFVLLLADCGPLFGAGTAAREQAPTASDFGHVASDSPSRQNLYRKAGGCYGNFLHAPAKWARDDSK